MKCFLDLTALFKPFNAFRQFKTSRPFEVQCSRKHKCSWILPRFGNSRNVEMTVLASPLWFAEA